MSAKKKPVKITDALCEAWREFADDDENVQGTYSDKDVRGLRRRVGKLRSTWEYYRQYRRGGDVVTLREVLGHFPEMKTMTARKEADLIAGKIAGGTAKQSKRQATTFEVAWERYLDHLKRKAEEKGKAALARQCKAARRQVHSAYLQGLDADGDVAEPGSHR